MKINTTQTSIVYQPSVLAAHWVLLFDDAHYVSLQYGHIQVLRCIEVPFSLEEFFRSVSGQKPGSVLVRLQYVVRLCRKESHE